MNFFSRIIKPLKKYGLFYVIKRIPLKLLEGRIENYSVIKKLFSHKSGIEIGGPSEIFRDVSYIPLYSIVENLDVVNFSDFTIWEGKIDEGNTFKFHKEKKGVQYICDAIELADIKDSVYDFLISSNCLEHIANPLKALMEWKRILKDGGLMLILVPQKEKSIDKYREITSFAHILQDFEQCTAEDDMTHLEDILKNHDFKSDVEAGSFEEFKLRSMNNSANRTLHHHVFNIELLKEMFKYLHLEVLLSDNKAQFNIILGRKTKD